MIDEKKLIERLEDMQDKCNTLEERLFFDGILAIVDTQPKVNEWIPVEERLPEESLNSVIGWDAYRECCVFVQYYMNDWILGNHEHVKIVAWMPLPEPYERKMKDDKSKKRNLCV